MRDPGIQLYQTPLHACAYWPERSARDILLDPEDAELGALYPRMLGAGFRRSGGHIYRPRCPACSACVPLRIPVADFAHSRSQSRCLRRNADVEVSVREASRSDEVFALYQRYLATRHAGGGMDEGGPEAFDAFIACRWSPTRFLQFRENDRLLAIAVTDVLEDALSAVYTFFDPGESARSLGAFAILKQIEWARSSGLNHLYLGFWIEGHPRMHYKSRYLPHERLGSNGWQRVAAR